MKKKLASQLNWIKITKWCKENNDLVKAYNHWVIKKVDLLGHKYSINSLYSLLLLQKRENSVLSSSKINSLYNFNPRFS